MTVPELVSQRPRRAYDVDALVDVAVQLFLERGYDATSISEIARAAGITKAAIYHHVASKEELLERGMQRAVDALSAVLDEQERSTAPAQARLRVVLRRTVEQMIEHLPEVALFLAVRGNSPVERSALRQRRDFDHRLEALVREAVREGSIRVDLEPGLLSRLLFGLTNSIVVWYRPGGRIQASEIASAVEALVMDGIVAGEDDAGSTM